MKYGTLSQRCAQAQQRSGDGLHTQHATHELRRRIRAAEAQQQGLTLRERENIEKREVLNYAKEHGLWYDSLYNFGQPIEGGGVENTLAYNAAESAIYKANNLSLYGGGRNNQTSILNLLQAVEIHNKLFPETAYELVGFIGIDTSRTQRTPYIEVVLRQAYIPNSTQATEQEIADYMQSIDFTPSSEPHSFEKDNVIVSDLRQRNVLKNANGNIFVVDNQIKYKQQ